MKNGGKVTKETESNLNWIRHAYSHDPVTYLIERTITHTTHIYSQRHIARLSLIFDDALNTCYANNAQMFLLNSFSDLPSPRWNHIELKDQCINMGYSIQPQELIGRLRFFLHFHFNFVCLCVIVRWPFISRTHYCVGSDT